jgi:hypothetical protein
MNDCIESTTIVTRTLIPEDLRLAHVEKLFGIHFPMRLEPVIYGITERMAKTYSGGYWNFYALDNGGFYFSPDNDQVFEVNCLNYWQGELSADALGIAACLYAYSHLSFTGTGAFPRECARQYHMVRAYMYDHAEVAEILGAID